MREINETGKLQIQRFPWYRRTWVLILLADVILLCLIIKMLTD